jgi:hypothetical protein
MPQQYINGTGVLTWEHEPRNEQGLAYLTRLELDRWGPTYNLFDLLPEDWRVAIGYDNNSAALINKTIRIGEPEGLRWMGNALHEFGHAAQSNSPNYSPQWTNYSYLVFNRMPKAITPQIIEEILDCEMKAWNYCFDALEVMQFPQFTIEKIKPLVEESIGNYVTDAYKLAPQAASNDEVPEREVKAKIIQGYDIWAERHGLITTDKLIQSIHLRQ